MVELDPAELEAMMAAADAFNTGLKDAVAFVCAGGLHPPSTAVTVDATGDSPTRTPGPFVEATDYAGGFWIIEAADEETALTWAGGAPPPCSHGSRSVRCRRSRSRPTRSPTAGGWPRDPPRSVGG